MLTVVLIVLVCLVSNINCQINPLGFDFVINRLHQYEHFSSIDLIVSLETGTPEKAKRGRPKGSTNAAKPAKIAKKKGNLTPEGRKKIADAMKRRWAAQRKDAPKKEAPKKEAVKK